MPKSARSQTLRPPAPGVTLGKTEPVGRNWPYPNYRTERPQVTVTPEYVRSLRLTERDRRILAYLNEVGYATADQMGQLFFAVTRPGKKARERLYTLWQQYVVDRMLGDGLSRYGLTEQLVYTLGRAGILILSEDDPESKLRARRGGLLVAHNTLLGETVVHLTQAGRAVGWTLNFQGERAAYTTFEFEGRWVKMRPDGVVTVQRSQGEGTAQGNSQDDLTFFVELDTGTAWIDVYLQKVLQYEFFFRSQVWRERYSVFPGVLVVVQCAGPTAEARARKTQRRLERVIERVQGQRREGVRWFFTTLAEVAGGTWQALDRRGDLRTAQLFPATECDDAEISTGG